MNMQSQNTNLPRNTSKAGTIPGKVSVGSGSKAPAAPATNTGPSGGSSVKGFSGGLIPGKV